MRHQRTTCKKKSPVEEFKCKYCKKVLSRKNSLERHLQTCPSKKEYKLNKEISRLETFHENKEKEWNKERKQMEKERKRLEKSIESLKQEQKTKNKKLKKIIEEKDEEIKKIIKEKDEEIMDLKIKCETNKADGRVEV